MTNPASWAVIGGMGAVLALASVAGAECMYSWSPLGSGTNGPVLAMTVFDDDGPGPHAPALYVGGAFTAAGGGSAFRVARWDGSNWAALGGGMNNTVNALAVYDDGSGGGPALYAAGAFTMAGGLPALRIAKWNGTNWSPVGGGLSNVANCLAVFNDGSRGEPELYVGGTFTFAGGVTVNRIAKWGGSVWQALAGGIDGTPGYPVAVNAMAVFNDGSGPALCVGGLFTHAGKVSAANIAQWSGAGWGPLGTGIFGSVATTSVLSMAAVQETTGPVLYVGGNFEGYFTSPTVYAANVARWNGLAWSTISGGTPSGVGGEVMAIEAYSDGASSTPGVYPGGRFGSGFDCGCALQRIARFLSPSGMQQVGGGVSGSGPTYVAALQRFDDGTGSGLALYAGGEFAFAGGQAANHIAKWGRQIPSVPADQDCDGHVNGTDLALFLGAWGPCPALGVCPADLNHDGIVNGLDLATLLGSWKP